MTETLYTHDAVHTVCELDKEYTNMRGSGCTSLVFAVVLMVFPLVFEWQLVAQG